VYLSLYKSWPTFQLENAVSALDSAWESVAVEAAEVIPIHNRDTRLAEIFLLPCLISCGLLIKLNIKNLTIISISFFSLALGLKAALDTIALGQNAGMRLVTQIGLLTILAIGFPLIVRWNPKDIFNKEP